ncbi:OmpA family protein [Pontibacter sp. 172403-2]|uniref:OmpA family protein n=1 Tax=Pontibacter rufus TaxID=2791028 RepID=UPI0018AFAC57|nr:OmpA family protein [Pontibacter sp. 172403-2]MBF9255460.1 OmpA family protein [Pontibacter sp. 172403-2]
MNYTYTSLYLVMAAILGLSPVANAQSNLRKANKHFDNYEYALALQDYQKVIRKRQPELQTMQHIADAYRLTRQSREAEDWYGKVVNTPGHEPVSLYYYAEALRSNGKYNEAKAQYMQWGDEMPAQAERAQELMRACDLAQAWMNQPAVAKVEAFQNINYDSYSDFSPTPYGKNGVIFTSDRGVSKRKKKEQVYGWTGRPYLQLFLAQQDVQGNWSNPMALQDVVNSDYHNATASAAAGSQKLYFTRTHLVLKRGNVNPDPTSWVVKPEVNEYVNRLEIFSAEKQNGGWSNIQPFSYNNVNKYSVGHPAVTPDGNTLYFVSDMPGGMGDTDIYYSVRQADGSWGEPVNAGTTVNTPGRESFPYVDADGKLYFASDGHTGMGGMDIFSAEGAQAAWTGVRNLGYPINSPKNDYGIMFTKPGESGLLSSNRDSQNGTDDIFKFSDLRKPVVLAVTTLERKQNALKQNIQVPLPQVNIKVSEQSATGSEMIVSDENGAYFMNGLQGNTYTFLGSKDGYLKQEVVAQVPETAGDTVQVALLFDKNEVARAVVLDNIYYDLDKWNIRPDAAKELDKVVTMLKNNPKLEIEMSSHTDSRESVDYNQQLSEKRAQAAVDYIVSMGIDRSRLTARGYGKTRLVNRCADGVECSEAEHQLNRRTEFKIRKN